MKKIYLFPVFYLILGCSVNNDDLHEFPEQDLNAVAFTEELCSTTSFDIGLDGKIMVANDAENLYVKVLATSEGSFIQQTNLHIVNNESDFPIVGKGNLPVGKMEYRITHDSKIPYYTITLPLDRYEGCVYLASQVTFGNGENSNTSWAGDLSISKGNFSYFKYCIQECSLPCEFLYIGPAALSAPITYSEANAIPSIDEARKLFANMIPRDKFHGELRELSEFNRYSPRMQELVTQFHRDLTPNQFETYDLTTVFTYGEGDCSGQIELTLTITDDRVW